MKMFNNAPNGEVTGSTFRNKHMNMRIPLKGTTEGVKHTNKTGSKILGFVKFFKHKEDRICGSFKEEIKQRAIFSEKYS